jgi:Undecaprenyl-phosphate glucose phosphotransferase
MNFNLKDLGALKNLRARVAPAGHPPASVDAPTGEVGQKRLSEPVLRGAIRVSDMAIIGISGLIMYLGSAVLHDQAFSSRYFSAIAVTVFAAAAIFQWAGVYTGDYLFSRRRRTETLLAAWLGTTVLMISAAFSLGVSEFYSRAWAGNWFVVAACLLVASRILVGALARDWAGEGRFANRTVIVGAGPQGLRLADHLRRHGDVRINIIGFVDDRSSRLSPMALDQPFLGNVDELLHLIRENKVDQVFVALPWAAENRLRDIALEIATTPVLVHLAPDMAGFQFPDRSFSLVAKIPMLNLFDRPISGADHVVKTAEDFVLGSILTVLIAPVMALIAMAIKLDSPGPVFFRQKRQGFNNNEIGVWKFRSMYTHMTDADCTTQTVRDDPRITRVGRFLRQSSLDELPQLFNVLNGTMSLVGPRPHAAGTKSEGRPFDDVVERYAARHRVKPGITGWAQVNGWRGETDTTEKIERRVEHDLYYIDNWSLLLDLKILLKTPFAIVLGKNAY